MTRKRSKAIAEAEAADAETARMNAVMYAGMVADAKIAADNEAMALAAAKSAAMTAANAAKTASDDGGDGGLGCGGPQVCRSGFVRARKGSGGSGHGRLHGSQGGERCG